MSIVSVKTLTLAAFSTSMMIAALPAQDAQACSPPLFEFGVSTLIPSDGSDAVPIDAPIAFKFTSAELNDTYGKYTEGSQIAMMVIEKSSGLEISGVLADGAFGSQIFTPDNPLSADTEYEASISDASKDTAVILHTWSFTTAADVDGDDIAPSFEGITKIEVKQVPEKVYSYCDEAIGMCGGQTGVHSGWSYPAEATVTFNALASDAFGLGYYAYKIYQHTSSSDPIDRVLLRTVPSVEQASTTITMRPDDSQGQEYCFSIVASSLEAPNAEIDASGGVVCQMRSGKVEIQPKPDTSNFLCDDGTSPVDPPEMPVVEEEDDWICGNSTTNSTPAGPLSTLLMVLAGMVGMRLKRRSTHA